jgi:hypothetical protein
MCSPSSFRFGIVGQHFYLNVPRVAATQGEMIPFHQELDGVSQRRDPFHQNRLAAHQAHLHETTPGAATTTDPYDACALSRIQVAQPDTGPVGPVETAMASFSVMVKAHQEASFWLLLQMILINNFITKVLGPTSDICHL